MNNNDPGLEESFDISVFEIPPAAAYFETIQQLQKVNAKLDVLLQNQCEIKARLFGTEVTAEVAAVRGEVARRYEANLLRYFEETELSRETLLESIHPDDRAEMNVPFKSEDI